jgi:hypothetical protein
MNKNFMHETAIVDGCEIEMELKFGISAILCQIVKLVRDNLAKCSSISGVVWVITLKFKTMSIYTGVTCDDDVS